MSPARVGVLLTLGALAVTASIPAQQFGDRTDVVVVEIPVQVTLKGQPVRGLTVDDFEIREGRKKHQIVGMDVLDLSLVEPAATATELPLSARRHFVLFFDMSFSSPNALSRARWAAMEMVESSLHPTDLVAVATFAERRGAQLVLGFTADRAQLAAALESLGIIVGSPKFGADPLKIMLDELERAVQLQGTSGGGQSDGLVTGPDRDAIFLEALRDLVPMERAREREVQEQQILNLSAGMAELAGYLDSVPGRKQIMLLSEGFDSSVVLGTEDPEAIQRMAEDVAFGEYWKVDSNERFGASATLNELTEMLEGFRRCDCTIQAIDIGRLAAGGAVAGVRPEGQNGLYIFAQQTGGELYRNYNDLAEAMGDLLERTAVTYLLTIQPENPAFEGSYHPLKVRLRDGPRGARLSYRPGYYDEKPFEELSAVERQLANAELVVGGRSGGEIETRQLVAPFKSNEDRGAYVLTALEVDGRGLLDSLEGNIVPIEIYTYAFDQQRRARDFFTQAIGLDRAKVGYLLRSSGLKFMGHLELPPGRYEVRTLVRNTKTGHTGLVAKTVVVPAYDSELSSLCPPLFIEPDERWLVGHAERSGSDATYPLIAGDRLLIPASRPRLEVGRSIPFLLVGHRLPLGSTADAMLEPLAGGPAVPATVTLEERFPTRVVGVERIAARIELGPTRPGSYRLVVTMRGEGGKGSPTSSVPVEVR